MRGERSEEGVQRAGGGGCNEYLGGIEIGGQAKMEALRAHVLVVKLNGRAWLVPASAVGLTAASLSVSISISHKGTASVSSIRVTMPL